MRLIKIDERGVYAYFPGFTVIAAIRIADLSFWEKIYKCIANCELCKRYSTCSKHT